MPFFKRHASLLFPLLIVFIGICIFAPYLHFQESLSTGDHGRDLYAAEAVWRGELPYKNFWWVYGPLTPYYYGIFYKIFGINISSIILGKFTLKILAGLFMYWALIQVVSIPTALIAACWFMIFHPDFFFTYNHIAGIAMSLAVAFCLLSYVRTSSIKSILHGLIYIFILGLIKINFAAADLVALLISVAVVDRIRRTHVTTSKKLFYTLGMLGVPLLLYAIYSFFLNGLTLMEIRQCLPYFGDDQPYNTTPWAALHIFATALWQMVRANWMNQTMAAIIWLSAIRAVWLLFQNRFTSIHKQILLLTLGILALLYAANFHEFLKSGVFYRAFWAEPLSMMISFVLIDAGLTGINRKIYGLVLGLIALLAIICWHGPLNTIKAAHIESQHIALPRADIYVLNSPDWINTVVQTTNYLNAHLQPNEEFFALPYDDIYYYLTGRRSPTRQLIFFDHIKIPPEQERSVLAELEKNNVRYVVVSSRAFSHQEYGLGILGQTYCPIIGAYLQNNFTVQARFGDWVHEPGWSWNHGTMILKRK